MPGLNETHDPALKSWVEPANKHDADFPIQNLPFSVFCNRGGSPRIGVAIGNMIFDVYGAVERGLMPLSAPILDALRMSKLNVLMALGFEERIALRKALSKLLSAAGKPPSPESLVVPAEHATLQLPAEIGDYTDFYASIHHATNVGKLFRPDNPLLPNYKHVPIGYHGRASSIVISGTRIQRPNGQTKSAASTTPTFGPTRSLDYELEVGFYIAEGNPLGEAVPIAEAESHIFGFCLVNDWSARDIQAWEYQPLGPFLSKSFATTVSPWVVTAEALEPFRTAASGRGKEDPVPLPYLDSAESHERGGLDISLEVSLSSAAMRDSGMEPARVSKSNFRDLYWTPAQLLTHQTSNGCNLRPGDLIASGTISGPAPESYGCLLELTRGGGEPIRLPTGESRRFLEDGDEVILRAWCERAGFARIGWGECRGRIVPASNQKIY